MCIRDRLDAVAGADTTRPTGLTEGRAVRAYGDGRIKQVSRLVSRSQIGGFPLFFTEPITLLGRSEMTVESGANGLSFILQPSSERVRLLLNHRPFDLPEQSRCSVERVGEGVRLDLHFANGEVAAWTHRHDHAYIDLEIGSTRRRIEDVIVEFEGVVSLTLPAVRGFNCQ